MEARVCINILFQKIAEAALAAIFCYLSEIIRRHFKWNTIKSKEIGEILCCTIIYLPMNPCICNMNEFMDVEYLQRGICCQLYKLVISKTDNYRCFEIAQCWNNISRHSSHNNYQLRGIDRDRKSGNCFKTKQHGHVYGKRSTSLW